MVMGITAPDHFTLSSLLYSSETLPLSKKLSMDMFTRHAPRGGGGIAFIVRTDLCHIIRHAVWGHDTKVYFTYA